jgi:hypothetical protein
MSGILQSYEVVNPIPRTQPFQHYKGKADYHGFSMQPDRLLRLSYLDTNLSLINSQPESMLLEMINKERTFISIDLLNQLPVSISIAKTPKNPISWEVTYLFPTGDPYDYINSIYQIKTEDFQYDNVGILSWSLSCNLEYAPFSGNGILEGYTTREISVSINANCDFDIEDFDEVDGILLEGLNISPNIHTMQPSRKVLEDTSLEEVYQFNWTFGVL